MSSYGTLREDQGVESIEVMIHTLRGLEQKSE